MGRILVVDDEAEVRGVLAEFFQALGHDVSQAENGPAALTLVARSRPDAVCLDLWMDGMPGLEVRLPLLFDAMVSQGRMGLSKFVELTATA